MHCPVRLVLILNLFKNGSSVKGAAAFGLFPFHKGLPAEQKADTPQTCQPDDGIYYPAEQGTGSAEQPGYQIKTKDPHQAPVDTADDGQDQRKGIHNDYLPFEFRYG